MSSVISLGSYTKDWLTLAADTLWTITFFVEDMSRMSCRVGGGGGGGGRERGREKEKARERERERERKREKAREREKERERASMHVSEGTTNTLNINPYIATTELHTLNTRSAFDVATSFSMLNVIRICLTYYNVHY